MKKIIITLFSLWLLVIIVACSKTTTQETTTTKQTTTTTKEKDILKPVLYGALNRVITVGDEFDPLEGVTAIDNVDGDITDKIEVSGDYDVNTPGTYTIYYTVKDSAGNETKKGITLQVKPVTVAGRILNPNFDEGLTYWGVWVGEGGEATAEVVDGVAVIDVKVVGNVNYAVQFEQKEITIEQGKFYEITFKAKASVERKIGVLMEDPNNGYHKYGNKIIDLTTEWATYTLEVAVDTGTINTAKLGFMLGKVDDGTDSKPAKIYLDDFTMTEVEPPEDTTGPEINGANDITVEKNSNFDPLAGISVRDNQDFDLTVNDIIITGDKISKVDGKYVFDTSTEGQFTITYKLTDASGNETVVTRTVTVTTLVFKDTNEVENGDFSTDEEVEFNSTEGATGWIKWNEETAEVTYTINDAGQLEVNITNLGNSGQSWTIQLQQYGINLVKGKTYKLVFDAKSTVNRDIKAVFKTKGETVYTSHNFSLTNEMDTYEFIFTVVQDSDNDMTLSFEMGKFSDETTASIITYDNIKLLELDEAALIKNGDFSDLGWETWYGDGDYAGFAKASYAVINGVMVIDIENVGNQPWAVQLNQLNLKFEQGKTYKLVFRVKADEARYLEVKVKDQSVTGEWQSKGINATTEFVTYEFEFTFGHSDAHRINFEMGYFTSGDTETSKNTKVYIDDVKLYVLDENEEYVDTNQIKNGDFESAPYWNSWWGDGDAGVSEGTVKVVDDQLVIDITNFGATKSYGIQVTQEPFTIKGDRTYIIEFDIKADNARPIYINIGEPLNHDPWFTHFMETYQVDVTTESQHVTIIFKMNLPTNQNGKLVFELGNITNDNGTPEDPSDDITAGTGKIYIDNVMIYPTFNPAE